MVINEAKLKLLLKEKGITKSALCAELGVSSRTIAKIGKGEDINEKVAQKIAEFLGVDNSDLVDANVLLKTLQTEMKLKVSGGLYHETQIKLTYNSTVESIVYANFPFCMNCSKLSYSFISLYTSISF